MIRLAGTLVDLYYASYPVPPVAVTLDLNDTVDVVHGAQQLSFWNGHNGERCFLPIHVYDTASGRPAAMRDARPLEREAELRLNRRDLPHAAAAQQPRQPVCG